MRLTHTKKEPEPLTSNRISGLLISFLWWCGILRKRRKTQDETMALPASPEGQESRRK